MKGFADSSAVFHNGTYLSEVACEPEKCDVDMRVMKGIALRSYARAIVAAPFLAEKLDPVIEASANATNTACSTSGDDVECQLSWASEDTDDRETASGGNLGEVFNALSAVQGLLYKSAAPLSSSNGTNTTGGSSGNGTGAPLPDSAGASSTIAASLTAVLAMAFAAALSI